MKMKTMLPMCALLGGALLLSQSAQPQPPQLPELLYARDFDANAGDWIAIGTDAKAYQVREGAKTGAGALRFDYEVTQGSLNALAAPMVAGALNTLQSLTFDIKSDHDTPLVVNLREQGGGSFSTPLSLVADKWQRVELAPADFVLQTNPNDAKDANGKLDMNKIEAFSLLDFSQIFVQDDVNNPVVKLLNVISGPRTLWLDDMSFSSKPLPELPEIEIPEGAISIDPFLRPHVSWLGIGNVALQRAVAEKPADNALQAQYEQAPGRINAMIKMLAPGILAGKEQLSFQIASEKPAILIVQLEETGGGKYNITVPVAGEVKPKMVEADFASFKPANDSKDDNAQLDLDQVKQIFVMEVAGVLGQSKGENTLWLGRISAK